MTKPSCLFYFLANVVLIFDPNFLYATDAPRAHWKGFYVGANMGGGIGGNSKSTDLQGFNYFCSDKSSCTQVPGEVTDVGTDTAFIGGGQIGYNYAFNTWVLGIEGDFSSFDINAAKTPASSKQDWGSDTLVSVEMNWLATVRGRMGITFDNVLLYGTGGAAFSNGVYRNHDFCNDVSKNCGSGLLDAKGDMGVGWTVGGGVEFPWMTNLTLKLEYLFVSFDGKEYSGTANFLSKPPEVYQFSASPSEFNIVRLGLNYSFGDPIGSSH